MQYIVVQRQRSGVIPADELVMAAQRGEVLPMVRRPSFTKMNKLKVYFMAQGFYCGTLCAATMTIGSTKINSEFGASSALAKTHLHKQQFGRIFGVSKVSFTLVNLGLCCLESAANFAVYDHTLICWHLCRKPDLIYARKTPAFAALHLQPTSLFIAIH